MISACTQALTCLLYTSDQIENGVAVGFPMEELVGDGVTENDLSLTLAPSAEERAKLDPFYMSYFVPWNSYKNYQIAKEHGFHDLTHEWDRTCLLYTSC